MDAQTNPRNIRFGATLALLFFLTTAGLSGAWPLWLDEILELGETRRPSVANMIESIPESIGSAPVGYLIERASVQMTGFSVRRARLPSAIFAGASVFFVVLLAAELGLKFPVLAGSLFAIFPLTVRYATEARVYSIALLFSLVSTLIYVRMAQRYSRSRMLGYCLMLILAVYTQPFAIFVGFSLVMWSILNHERKIAISGAAALGIAILALIPWYLWSKSGWVTQIQSAGMHFAFSFKTVLMIFRELAGAGYWGSGLLLILGVLALPKMKPRVPALLLLLIAVPIALGIAADAAFGYLIAARQFIWVLPAVSILAALAVEQSPRLGKPLTMLLALVCSWYVWKFYSSPHEDFAAAASVLSDQVQKGECLVVVPEDHIAYYEFFQPKLRAAAQCHSSRVVLAISPYASTEQQTSALGQLAQSGFQQGQEQVIGKSRVFSLHRP